MQKTSGMESLKHVFGGLERTLGQRHEVVYQPLEYFWTTSTSQQGNLGEEFIKSCDLLVGRIDEENIEVERTDRWAPAARWFFDGHTCRAEHMELAALTSHLKSTDMLVGNCTADLDDRAKVFQ